MRCFLARFDSSLLTAAGCGAWPRKLVLRPRHAAYEVPGAATCALGLLSWGCGVRVGGSGRVVCVGVVRSDGVPSHGKEPAGRADCGGQVVDGGSGGAAGGSGVAVGWPGREPIRWAGVPAMGCGMS